MIRSDRLFWLGGAIGFLLAILLCFFAIFLHLKLVGITVHLDKQQFVEQLESSIRSELKFGIDNFVKELGETIPEKVTQETIDYLQQQKIRLLWGEITIPHVILENLKPFLFSATNKIISEQFTEEKINMFSEQQISYLKEGLDEKIGILLDEQSFEIELFVGFKTKLRIKWK